MTKTSDPQEISSNSTPPHVIQHSHLTSNMLQKKGIKALPDGEFKISNIIDSWPNKTEVFPLKHASAIAALLAFPTAAYVNYTIRTKLYIIAMGNIPSYFAAVFAPTALVLVAHETMVKMPLLDEWQQHCPVCLQVRSGLIQAGFGIVQPALVGSILALSVISRLKSYRMPNMVTNPRASFKYAKNIMKPILIKRIPLLAVGQLLIGMLIAYIEQDIFASTVIPQLNYKQLAEVPAS